MSMVQNALVQELGQASTRDMVVLANVVKYFRLGRRRLFGQPECVHSVDGVTMRVRAGEALGLVGESGSGKSTLARVILRLLDTDSGTVSIDGENVTRGSKGLPKALRAKAQKLLVCDEPTSALDASVQAKVLNLLTRLRTDHQLTMLVISHDLRVVRHVSDRLAVMYLGQIVETADREDLFEDAVHPYTIIALLSAALPVGGRYRETVVAAGEPPSPINPPAGAGSAPDAHCLPTTVAPTCLPCARSAPATRSGATAGKNPASCWS